MQRRLRNFFRIRPGEGRLVGLLIALMFFPNAGGAIGSPSVESLFYSRFGVEFLPYMYMALGVVTLITSMLITGVLGRMPKNRLYMLMPIALGAVLAVSRILVAFDLNWFYPVLWLIMYLMWTLQALLIWGVAGQVCTTRQAKRLFPLFGAGGILGSAIGGLTTPPLVAVVGTENLLVAWSFSFAAILIVIRTLSADLEGPSQSRPRSAPSFLQDLTHGYRSARRSPLLVWVSLAALLLSLLFFALAFPFSQGVAAQFPDEDALASFLGVFQGSTTAAALLASLLFANRLYARVGFMGAVFVLPVIYFLGFSAVSIFPLFAVLVGFRFIQLAWRLGLADSAYQAVFNILPGQRREQTRTFINGGPSQAGIVLIGLILALGQRSLQPEHLFWIGAGAAMLAIFVTWRALKAYSGELVTALRSGQPQIFFSGETPFGGFQQDAGAVAAVLDGVKDPDPVVRRISAEILGNLSITEATESLVRALEDPDPEVRVALLRSIARTGDSAAILEVAMCLNDESPGVRLQAIRSLSQLARFPRGLTAYISHLLDDRDRRVRATVAVISLRAGPNPEAADLLISMAKDEDPEHRIQALEAFSELRSGDMYPLAEEALKDPLPRVRRVAAAAVASMDGVRGLDSLVAALADPDRSVRSGVAESLGKLGEEALEPALAALDDPRLEDGALEALQNLPTGKGRDTIRAYVSRKIVRAAHYETLWHYSAGTDGFEPADRLLERSLVTAARRQAKRGFRALSLLGNGTPIRLALGNIESEDPEQRANAIETLESVVPADLAQPLLRLWESPEPPSASEIPRDWLVQVLQDEDSWLRACGCVATDLEVEQHRAALVQLTEAEKDPFVREAAQSALLDGGPQMETLATLSTMDRILFLQRVPLFADLPPADLKQVAAIATESLISDGEVFVHQGERGEEMYIIVSGEVAVLIRGKDGEEMEVARRHTGEYVGEMSIVTHEPRMASLVAHGEVRTLSINRLEFEGILRERPEISLAIIRELCSRLTERPVLSRDPTSSPPLTT